MKLTEWQQTEKLTESLINKMASHPVRAEMVIKKILRMYRHYGITPQKMTKILSCYIMPERDNANGTEPEPPE